MLGVFWKIQEICSKMCTRILKIALKMTQIIDLKIGNPLKKDAKSAIKIILSKSSLSHILCCNLINFWHREESKVSFWIVVSWAVEKWSEVLLYVIWNPRKQQNHSVDSFTGHPVHHFFEWYYLFPRCPQRLCYNSRQTDWCGGIEGVKEGHRGCQQWEHSEERTQWGGWRNE